MKPAPTEVRAFLNSMLRQVRDAANNLAAGNPVPDWFTKGNGICGNLEAKIDDAGGWVEEEMYHRAMGMLGDLFAEYTGYFGKAVFYPVGGRWEYESAQKAGTLWKNPKRRELLNWLIEETECAQ